MKKQKGITLLGVLFVGFILLLLTVLVMKVAPDYIEYFGILENINAIASDPGLRDGNASGVRTAYGKRAEVNHSKSITQQDLIITKEGGVWQISFAYSKTIPLFANVSLLLDFEGKSTAR